VGRRGKPEIASERFNSVVEKFHAFTAVNDLNLEVFDRAFLVPLRDHRRQTSQATSTR
jgi:hypothetical protein